MSSIREDAKVLTLINTFTVQDGRQDELVALLDEATVAVMRNLPGFVSANIHASADRKHVANYAQWQSLEHFQAMLKNPEAQKHMAKCTEIADAQPVLYEVRSVFERS